MYKTPHGPIALVKSLAVWEASLEVCAQSLQSHMVFIEWVLMSDFTADIKAYRTLMASDKDDSFLEGVLASMHTTTMPARSSGYG